LNCQQRVKKNAGKYCCHKCGHRHKEKEEINKWFKGEHSGVTEQGFLPIFIKNYIWKKYNNQCDECSWHKINPITNKVPLHIHHIDGNSKNNKEENLRLLCPNCHSLTPNFGRLNKSGTRDKRRLFD
jgi:Zn finger protein HypA/HybF involved in hydrogenase expression